MSSDVLPPLAAQGPDAARAAMGPVTGRDWFWPIVLGFLVFWLVESCLGAPRGGAPDVFVYKEPGCNMAAGLGFTAWGMPGTGDLDRHLFATSGPAIPFLFGLVASVLGCTGRVNTLFELSFAAVSTIGIAYLLAPSLSRRWRPALALLIGLALPSGLLVSEIDRPGVPAFPIFLLACLAARAPRPLLRTVLAPYLAGICAVFFPFGGALAGLAVWVIAAGMEPPTLAAISRLAARQFAAFLVPIALVMALYGWLDPTAGARFLGNGFGSHTGAGAVLSNSYGRLLGEATFSAGAYSLSLVTSSAFSVAIVLAFAVVRGSRRLADLVLLCGLAAFPLVTVLIFPKQSDYMAWARTGLVVLLLCSAAPLAQRARRSQFVAILVALGCLANIPFVWMETLKQVQTATDYRLAQTDAATFATTLARAPSGGVAVPSGVYFLYKPLLPQLVDLEFLHELVHGPSDLAGIAACYRGSRDGTPVGEDVLSPHPYLPPLIPLSRARSHYVPTVFGVRVSRTEWGWSCDHYLTQR